MPRITLPIGASKLAQQNLVSTSRVGLVFTYTLGLEGEGNDPGADAPANDAFQTTAGRLLRQSVNVNLNGLIARELVVGAGWKSVRLEQNINVTQENALGWYDIVETIEHNVASNTMTASKMMLRWAMLSNIGLAPFGVETLISPLLNCYVFDPKELQQGNDVGYVRLERLHIQTNGIDVASGQTVMENVTFRPNNIRRVDNRLPDALFNRIRQLFPGIAEDLEVVPQQFTFDSAVG
ncbi:hypothetical protein [Deinococcus sp. S9]|uniref:hypothetical protein n=1 Tax=Deinococcus sp. S9 TaxID=2545754 RepID=UPI00105503AE|nr:hypothetical protein [Deinococcus sp. S9]TDE85576.1 hypothetical protein E0686_11230 [Deinococcus sp. S9]